MPHFTEEELQELESIFGIKRVTNTIYVRDGYIKEGDTVWWRGKDGPELVCSADPSHLPNIKKCPNAYQIEKPKMKFEYLD